MLRLFPCFDLFFLGRNLFQYKQIFYMRKYPLLQKLEISPAEKTFQFILSLSQSIQEAEDYAKKTGPQLRVSPICGHWLGYSGSRFTALRRFVSNLQIVHPRDLGKKPLYFLRREIKVQWKSKEKQEGFLPYSTYHLRADALQS